MLGAIIGDIVGSIYEFQNTKSIAHGDRSRESQHMVPDPLCTRKSWNSKISAEKFGGIVKKSYLCNQNLI